SLVARDATVEAGRAAVAAGDPASAVEDLKPLVDAGDGEAAVVAGDARAAGGDTSGAITLYRRAYFYDPASASGAAAANQLRALGADPATLVGTEEEMLSRANRLFAGQQWRDASDAYGR